MSKLILGIISICTLYQVYVNYFANRIPYKARNARTRNNARWNTGRTAEHPRTVAEQWNTCEYWKIFIRTAFLKNICKWLFLYFWIKKKKRKRKKWQIENSEKSEISEVWEKLFQVFLFHFCEFFFLADWLQKLLQNKIDLLLFYREHFCGFSESV